MRTEQDFNNKLQEGLEYQDFLTVELNKRYGMHLMAYSSIKYQYSMGESLSCIEVKYDQGIKKYGNVYIEYADRRYEDRSFGKRGILRNDNTIWWAIGDYEKAFILSKHQLVNMYHMLKRGQSPWGMKGRETPTSKGFIIPVDRIAETPAFNARIDFRETYENNN